MSIRLINTFTLHPTTLTDDELEKVQYAILSHTWEDNEVSFQEMMAIMEDPNHPAAQQAGYEKIRDTCQKAREDSIDYVWIDTCCIDKTSSAELSEAINSMYRWYHNATVCYAYLADLGVGSANLDTKLPHCRWFTRGWCLQELLAPSFVRFYDKEWGFVGSKATLAPLISSITRIDKEVLANSSLIGSYPVAHRMCWAAGRETSRVEDKAYCLLGIFDINMPLLYGEGHKAFQRLQEQIMMSNNDLSIFAFQSEVEPGKTGTFSDLLATSPGEFSQCGDVFSEDSLQPSAFTLTNGGLYFPRQELDVDAKNGLYSLRLNCYSPNMDCTRIHLRKIGAGLFAKWINPEPVKDQEKTKRVVEEVSIINRLTPSTKLRLQQYSKHAIRVRSDTHDLFRAIQVPQPSTSNLCWDNAKMQFLTLGKGQFRGCFKLFPSLAKKIQVRGEVDSVERATSGHVYVACGLTTAEDISNPRPWVRLYTAEAWAGLEKEVGIWTDLVGMNGHRSDSVTLVREEAVSIAITASIRASMKEEGPLFFNLVLNITKE